MPDAQRPSAIIVTRLQDGVERILAIHGNPMPGVAPGVPFSAEQADGLSLASEYVLDSLVHRVYAGPASEAPMSVLAQRLVRAVTPRECALALLEAADSEMGYDSASISLFPEDRRRSFPIINIDRIGDQRHEVKAPFTREPVSPMTQRVFDDGPQMVLRRPSQQRDPVSFVPFGNTQRRSGSLLFAPIASAGETFGIVSLQKYAFDAYTAESLARLAELTEQASGAFARTFSLFKLRQEESVARSLTVLARQLGGTSTVREAGILILDAADELFGWDAGFINLCTEDLATTFPVVTFDTIDGERTVINPTKPREVPSPMASRVLREGATLLLFDSVARQDYEEMSNFGDKDRLSNSLMFAPIRTMGRTVGLMSIQSYAISAYSHHDLEVFQALADHCGAALRRIQAEEDLRRKEAQLTSLERENEFLREHLTQRPLAHPEAFAPIITNSVRMKSIFHQIEAVARSPQPVLIMGETGVGKELLARAVHIASERTGPFVPLNVAGVDDDFFSDALFGHLRGAYTNALTERRGFVEAAAGGTLFLDEIGDLSLTSQVKLLRLLQENEYYPIGADRPRRSEARIVVATNTELAQQIAEGSFRKDLYYRLQAHALQLPPLRERDGDIPLLVAHFVEAAAEALGVPTPRVPREVSVLLRQYDFPGNVRELEGMIHDAVSKAERGILSLALFEERVLKRDSASAPLAAQPLPAQPVQFGERLPGLKEVQELLIEEALSRTDNNQSMAARLLGVTQQALNQRVQTMRSGRRRRQPS